MRMMISAAYFFTQLCYNVLYYIYLFGEDQDAFAGVGNEGQGGVGMYGNLIWCQHHSVSGRTLPLDLLDVLDSA